MVRGLDVIVYDIQDVGAAFLYLQTTLGYFLEAAARAGKPVVVLDRPNPLNGAYVQGPVADAGDTGILNFPSGATRFNESANLRN